MLTLFLENGATLSELTAPQFKIVYESFSLYLVHAISFREAQARCYSVIGDRHDLRVNVRTRLAAMIEDPYAVLSAKPALLRLATGDSTLFRCAGIGTRRASTLIANNKTKFGKACRACKFSSDEMSESWIKSHELEYIERVRSHAKRYTFKKALFLTFTNERSTDDIINDLLILAMRAFRWYFPFRRDLHMLNTMRATITNRGHGLIKHSVVDTRKRLIQLPTGESINLETSGFDGDILDGIEGSDPSKYMSTMIVLDKAATDPKMRPVIEFIRSDDRQDRFVTWASHRLGVKFSSINHLSSHIRENRLSYSKILSTFLQQSHTDVAKTLLTLRSNVIC